VSQYDLFVETRRGDFKGAGNWNSRDWNSFKKEFLLMSISATHAIKIVLKSRTT
jgi:hypothetical protein